MNVLRVFAKRIGLGAIATWVILTTVFLLFSVTPDWVLEGRTGLLRYAGASDAEREFAREQYLQARGLSRPLWERYADWMGNMVTLQWGESFTSGEPAFPLVIGAVERTAMYALPALVVALTIGILVGLYAALNPDSWLASGSLGTAYLLFVVPNFWLGGLLFSMTLEGEEKPGSGEAVVEYSPLVFEHALPIALTATTLLGGYVSYARAHSLEYATADFTTLVKAKGASPTRIARHVLRNAAIPLFSMLFTEGLALLVLAVFVIETLFGIDGFGLLLVEAVAARDLPVLFGGIIVVIGVGVVGNIVQDLSYGALDPRVDTGTR